MTVLSCLRFRSNRLWWFHASFSEFRLGNVLVPHQSTFVLVVGGAPGWIGAPPGVAGPDWRAWPSLCRFARSMMTRGSGCCGSCGEAGAGATWKRAQMVLLFAQSMAPGKIAEATFTSADRVRDVIHNFNDESPPATADLLSVRRQLTGEMPQVCVRQIDRRRVDEHAKLLVSMGDLGRQPIYQELRRSAELSNTRPASSDFPGDLRIKAARGLDDVAARHVGKAGADGSCLLTTWPK